MLSVINDKLLKSVMERSFFDDSFFSGFNLEQDEYPPYNIWSDKSTGNVNLEISVCGFNPQEISVEIDKDNTLIVTGKRQNVEEYEDCGKTYYKRKLATRNFKQQFKLFPSYEVKEAEIKNGILYVSLKKIEETKSTKKLDIKY